MKYSTATYENCGYWTPSEGESHYSSKVVRVRRKHRCVGCSSGHEIQCGSYALMEQCILEGTGRVKAYTCLDLLDKWIEEHNLQ